MLIALKKFGDILTSREAGREALSAFLPTLHSLGKNEEIKIDFEGISVLTPSWADEFIRPILEKNAQKVSFINDTNPSVKAALRFADPKLDLSKMTVFEDKIVFDEAGEKSILTLTFPYSDEEALNILSNNKIKKISVQPADDVSDARLKTIIQMLNQASIKTKIN